MKWFILILITLFLGFLEGLLFPIKTPLWGTVLIVLLLVVAYSFVLRRKLVFKDFVIFALLISIEAGLSILLRT